MKKNIALSRLLVGLLLTALAYFVSMFVGHQWHLNSSILADSYRPRHHAGAVRRVDISL